MKKTQPAKAKRFLIKKRFEAFEFGDEEEKIESDSKKSVSKYSPKHIKNNKSYSKNHSPLTKYTFLQFFAKGTTSKDNDVVDNRIEVEDADDTIKGGLASSSCSSNHQPATCTKNEQVTICLDDDDIESISSTSSSNIPGREGKLEEQALQYRLGGCEIDDVVVINPDYIVYGNIYSNKCGITFSCSCVKVEYFSVCESKGSLNFEWKIGDIINIESQWCSEVQTALVNLRLRSGDKELADCTEISKGGAQLRFAVYDPNWFKQERSIKLLNVRYEAIWNLVSDLDVARNEDGCLDTDNIFLLENNFPNPNESFKEVIYPRGDPDAVSVNMRDIELLQPETFINDTIIDFYIIYLKNKITPGEEHRFHFFNSFFFRKLADLDKDRSGAGDARAAFQRVRKWTKKVNLFEKDYIFIPVNFSFHWSLIVICHPGDAANFKDVDAQNSPKVPCILHMDSIRGSHRGLRNFFQSYLWEEWKDRGNQPEDVSSKFLNLQFIPLELPQQENSFDCGIFLLHYVELFLKHAPLCFNPVEATKILNKSWFPPAEASRKRIDIKNLINQIVEHDYQDDAPTPCNRNEYLSPEVLIIEEPGTDAAKLSEGTCKSPETSHSHYSSSISDQEIGTAQSRGTPRCIQCSKEQDSGERRLFDESCHSLGQLVLHDRLENAMSPIEEVDETSEQVAESEVSSLEIGFNGHILFEEFLGSSPSESREILDLESLSTSSDELAACIVPDSEEEEGAMEVDYTRKSSFGLKKVLRTSKIDSIGNFVERADDVTTPMAELDERLGAKRSSPMPPERGRRRIRSSLNDPREVYMCE